MTENEAAALRAVYQRWPVERLARAATLEKNDYTPEAVAAMLEELSRRGVAGEELARAASLPPAAVPVPEKPGTLLLPARLNRKQYVVRWLIWVATFIGVACLLECAPALQPGAFLAWLPVGMAYKIMGLDIPRMRNAGLSPWLLLLQLIPIVNLVIVLLLFIVPPEK